MFFEKLENLLKERKMNLNQLSKAIGIAQSPTSRWKTGTMPNAETLIKICQYLNVSADYLLDLDEEVPPPKLSDQEEKLLDHFRQCDAGTQKSILMLASSGAAEAESTETSLNSKNAG